MVTSDFDAALHLNEFAQFESLKSAAPVAPAASTAHPPDVAKNAPDTSVINLVAYPTEPSL